MVKLAKLRRFLFLLATVIMLSCCGSGLFTGSRGLGGAIVDSSLLGAPTNVVAQRTASATIGVSWDAVTGASSYRIYSGISAGSANNLVDEVTALSYSDSARKENQTYYYRVAAVNAAGEGSLSTEVNATAYSVPRKVTAFGTHTAQDAQVTIQWLEPYGTSPITAYRLYRGNTSSFTPGTGNLIQTSGSNTLSYVDSAVVNGTTYYYKIIASNSYGDGPESLPLSARPLAPGAAQDLTYLFLDTAAAAGGDGSLSTPYNSLATAYANLTAGGTIVIKDGTVAMAGGTQTLSKAATIRSVSGHYEFSSAIFQNGTYQLTSLINNISIYGLTFENSRMRSPNFNDDVTVVGNYFHDYTDRPLVKTSSAQTGLRWTVVGNYVKNMVGATSSGMYLFGINDCDISYNRIENTGYGGLLTDNVQNCTISYNRITNTPKHGIQLAGAQPQNVTISYNEINQTNTDSVADHGCLRLYGVVTGPITISWNTFNNCYNGFAIKDGEDISGKTITLRNNTISNNTNEGAHYNSTGSLDAAQNYWGAASGPLATGNSSGTGDRLLSGVTYSPFKKRP